MTYYSFSGLFNAIVSLLLACLILGRRTSNRKLANSLFFWCLSVASWSCFYFLWQIETNYDLALLWTRLLMFGAVWVPVSFLNVVLTFLDLNKKYRKFFIAICVLSVIFSILLSTPLMVSGLVARAGFKFWPTPGWAYAPFLAEFFGLSVLAVWLSVVSYQREKTRIKKLQLKIILIGIAISIIGGSTNYFLWYNIPIKPYGNIFASTYVLMSFYAIFRYRFLDIKIFIKKSWILAFSLGTVFGYAILFRMIFPNLVFMGIPSTDLLILLTSVLIFPYLKKFYSGIANKYFSYTLYDVGRASAEINKRLLSTLNQEKVYEFLNHFFADIFNQKCLCFLLLNSSGRYYPAFNNGFNISADYSPTFDRRLIDEYLKKGKIVEVENIKPGNLVISKKGSFDSADFTAKADLLVPMIAQKGLIGIMVIGRKESGEVYLEKDLNFFAIAASQIAAAAENMGLYSQIRVLNESLEKKVKLQTAEIRHEAEELELKNEHLEKLLEMKNEFLRLVNHQLNTPISIIRNSIFMIKSGSFTADKGMSFIEDSLKKIEDIVNEFWKAFSFDGEGAKLDLQETDLGLILTDLVDTAVSSPLVRERALVVRLDRNIDLPKVKSDPKQIGQAISNLLQNAISYTNSGSVTIYFAITDKNFLKVFIEDTGCGIDEEDKGKIFEKFVRGKRAINERPAGSGLGLYIAKRIVEAGGGELKLEKSEVGKGSTFSLTLPIWN